MATGAAGDGMFRSYEGSLPGRDYTIERRPYHRNCQCALHNLQGTCSHSSPKSTISYPIRRSWSEGCLGMTTYGNNSSPSSSPVVASGDATTRIPRLLPLCDRE